LEILKNRSFHSFFLPVSEGGISVEKIFENFENRKGNKSTKVIIYLYVQNMDKNIYSCQTHNCFRELDLTIIICILEFLTGEGVSILCKTINGG